MRKISTGHYQIIARLKRTTTSSAYISEIDGLRVLSLAAIYRPRIGRVQRGEAAALPLDVDNVNVFDRLNRG